MSKNQERGPSCPARITLMMRLAGGVYLVYLAYQLIPEITVSAGGRNLIRLLCMAIFFTVGALLTGWSIKKLLKGEFIHPGENEEEGARKS